MPEELDKMDLNTVLQNILACSKRHLQLAVDEQWEDWADLFDRKSGWCERLDEFEGASPNAQALRTIREIQAVEAQCMETLKEKQAVTRMKLEHVGRRKNVLAGYGANKKDSATGHFGIRC